MPIIKQKHITRLQIQQNREKFYIFGDNMIREGFGGQAREMRGEPNSIGIPTKWKPNTNATSYFSNSDWNYIGVRLSILSALDMIERILENGNEVIIPSEGIGTGFARLNSTAPKIFNIITFKLQYLEGKF